MPSDHPPSTSAGNWRYYPKPPEKKNNFSAAGQPCHTVDIPLHCLSILRKLIMSTLPRRRLCVHNYSSADLSENTRGDKPRLVRSDHIDHQRPTHISPRPTPPPRPSTRTPALASAPASPSILRRSAFFTLPPKIAAIWALLAAR